MWRRTRRCGGELKPSSEVWGSPFVMLHSRPRNWTIIPLSSENRTAAIAAAHPHPLRLRPGTTSRRGFLSPPLSPLLFPCSNTTPLPFLRICVLWEQCSCEPHLTSHLPYTLLVFVVIIHIYISHQIISDHAFHDIVSVMLLFQRSFLGVVTILAKIVNMQASVSIGVILGGSCACACTCTYYNKTSC